MRCVLRFTGHASVSPHLIVIDDATDRTGSLDEIAGGEGRPAISAPDRHDYVIGTTVLGEDRFTGLVAVCV